MQEVAANMQQATTRKRISGSKAEGIARRYFTAIAERDLETAVSLWAEGGRENVRGQVDTLAPEGVREFIGGLIGAIPDLDMQVVSTTSEGERCGVQWRLKGTFAGPGSFGGIAPTGQRIELEGFDLITVKDGLITSNDAFTDSMTFARQIGMMPPQDSAVEQRMTSAFNAKTRLTAGLDRGRGAARRRGRLGRAGPAGPLQRLPARGGRRRDAVRRGGKDDEERRGHAPEPSWAGSTVSCWAMATPTTAELRRRWASRSSATRPRSRMPKAAADSATGPRA